MADTKNTEVLPASEPPASLPTAAPVTVVREKRNWATPLIAALVVVIALVVGGVGGFALARATGPGGDRQAIQQGQLPHGSGSQFGPGGHHGPGGQPGQHPRPGGDSTEDSDEPDESENAES
jgi:hypothetical protein